MEITKDEKQLIKEAQIFKNDLLTKVETELVIQRKLTDEEWECLNKDKQPKKPTQEEIERIRAEREQLRSNQHVDKYFRMNLLFKQSSEHYTIEQVHSEEEPKNYNTKLDCTNCSAKNVPSMYYNIDKKVCTCCEKILQGGTNRCGICFDTKNIDLFQRPYLKFCRECAATLARNKYHKNNYTVNCECGSIIKNMHLRTHIKTKKHLEYIKTTNKQ